MHTAAHALHQTVELAVSTISQGSSPRRSSQLGVDYNAAMLETIAREIAPALGSTRDDVTAPVD